MSEGHKSNGTKQVIFQGKVIGTIPDCESFEESAALVDELITKKGLHNDLSKEKAIFNQAVSFGKVVMNIYHSGLSSKPWDLLIIPPFVVNSAFCVEMYLKCLLEMNGEMKSVHSLILLFDRLPQKVKLLINEKMAEMVSEFPFGSNGDFRQRLSVISNAFVNWRYIYESESGTINVQDVILIMRVLDCIARSELNNKQA
ncbi:hypothetical protein [Plesiomonas shigelloides]|uniref:hypothetical protein n=1 Tax=Plesiomonas shigelloides TaxID=703 RepID=UPI0031B7511E